MGWSLHTIDCRLLRHSPPPFACPCALLTARYFFLHTGLMGAMSLALHRVVYVGGDYILREGEIGKDMYFVASGEVQVSRVVWSSEGRCRCGGRLAVCLTFLLRATTCLVPPASPTCSYLPGGDWSS